MAMPMISSHRALAYSVGLESPSFLWLSSSANGLKSWADKSVFPFTVKPTKNVQPRSTLLDAYAKTAVTAAHALGVDGVICGHLPHAAHRQIDQIHFMTTGDWRTSQTALVEHLDGRFEIIESNTGTPVPSSLLTLNPA